MGELYTYSGGGYVYQMKGGNQIVQNETQRLETLSWIDKQTSALFIEFTTYNPNLNMFQSCLFLFEILNSGSIVTSSRFKSIDLFSLNQTLFHIILNVIYLLLVCVLMLKELRDVIRRRIEYFKDFYNYNDLLIVGFSWTSFAMYLYKLNESYDIQKILKKNTSIQEQTFINLQYLVTCDFYLNSFLGFCAFFATLRFLKIFRLNKRIIVFMESFKRSVKDMVNFSVIFFIVWLSFVQVFFLLLNAKSIKYSSFTNTTETCFEIILGKFNADKFLNSGSFIGPFIFVAYNIVIVFVMTNLFVSILIDNYEELILLLTRMIQSFSLI